MNPLCLAEGIGLIPWSPLARGFLAGNRRGREQGFGDTTRAKTDDYAQRLYYQESDFAVVERVTEIARRRGVSNAQVALAWLLHQPGVTAPIIGPRTLEQLTGSIRATEIKLDASAMKKLDEIFPGPGGEAPKAYAW